MTILEELANRNIIQASQIPEIVNTANVKYNGNIDQVLLSLNIDESQILEVKSALYNIPAREVDPETVAVSTLQLIPRETANIYHFVPIGMTDDVLEIGITDGENVQTIDVLTFITAKMNKPFKLFLIKMSVYNKLLEKYDALGSEVEQVLSELDSEIAGVGDKDVIVDKKTSSETASSGIEDKIIEDAPIIKIVAVVLRHAVEGNASDIHIENVGDSVKVRFRVDGLLHTSLVLPISVYSGVVARIKILSKLRLDEKRKPQDGGFSAKIDGHKIDFRVSTMPSYYGEKIVMRILDSERGVQRLENINMSVDNLAMVREALKKPYGLILITGPTGSGKTTTLYSMLAELDHEVKNIVSLEDPVEYQMPGVNQSQVAPEIGYTFASGLRSILRQDPDIVMVGEIRDKETAELAIQAALTGHLVLSTLHTNNSVGAIPRLIDMGIDPYLIAPTLVLCMAQRLARKIYTPTAKQVAIDEATKIMIQKQFEDLPEEFKSKINFDRPILEAVASPDYPSGMSGRVAIFEMFKIDKEMQSIILKKPVESEIYKLARSRGMLSIREDAIIKALEGKIPFMEIYNY
jgi:type IV pilus assembly protein PilB